MSFKGCYLSCKLPNNYKEKDYFDSYENKIKGYENKDFSFSNSTCKKEKKSSYILLTQLKKLFLHKINFIIRSCLLFLRIKKNLRESSVDKIASVYRSYCFRKKFYYIFLINRIIQERAKAIEKIKDALKLLAYKIKVRKLLDKLKDTYIIYSSIQNETELYFVENNSNSNNNENRIQFTYYPSINCFALFIDKDEIIRPLIGNFYNENNNLLFDDLYPINNSRNGKVNIIDISSLIKKRKILMKQYDLSITKTLTTQDKNLIKETTEIKKKEKIMLKSKSCLRLRKSILKPTKSYCNLKKFNKRVMFGEAQYKYYENKI